MFWPEYGDQDELGGDDGHCCADGRYDDARLKDICKGEKIEQRQRQRIGVCTIDMKFENDARGGKLPEMSLCLVGPRDKPCEFEPIEVRQWANFMRALRPIDAAMIDQHQQRARATRRCFLRGSEVEDILGKQGGAKREIREGSRGLFMCPGGAHGTLLVLASC